MGELTKDDFFAVSLETVLHVQQFLLSAGQSIALDETGSIRNFIWSTFMRVFASQSELFSDGILDPIALIDLSDVIME